MFSKILIANRGAIACRILRTVKRMGIRSVAVFRKPMRTPCTWLQADEALHRAGAGS
jgi:urea carboxylase